jgi:hypothetical protein
MTILHRPKQNLRLSFIILWSPRDINQTFDDDFLPQNNSDIFKTLFINKTSIGAGVVKSLSFLLSGVVSSSV